MRKFAAVFLSIVLLSFSYSMNSEASALTLKEEKESIIAELEIIKNDSDVKKKKKSIDAAIKKIEKSLDDKFWKDDSTLNFKPGKKVLNADKNAIDKLDKILKDKKEEKSIKEDIFEINLRIVEVDKVLVENAIDELDDIIMSKKGLKKLDKAENRFEKGEEFLEDEKYQKAIKNFIKAWDQIKKSLKDPHFKKMKMVGLEGTLDMNFDKIPDVYLKIVDPGKPNKPKIVQMKITGPCVNGEIHDDAAMKIGVSVPDPGPGL